MKQEGASFLLAVQFLTRIPIPSGGLYTPERMAASVRYYPMVGLLVGCVCAAVFALSLAVFPQVIAILLAIAASLLVTGGFHEDGLADTFDGIGGGLDRDRALEVMRDSRLGTYGTLALVMVLSTKAVSLALLPVGFIVATLMAAHSLSRLSSVLVIATSTYVRAEGTGKPVAEGVSLISLVMIALTGAAIVAVWCWLLPPMALGCAAFGLVVGHGAMRLFFEPKLGGYTGDTLGAVQQVSELGFYLGLLAWL
ncbi:MAG: adenosylcobinamide-GDP ribazoletransferase [Pseudomonadota bacterium]